MNVQIIRADARALPIKSGTVDLVVTSPPYWSLRAYQDNGETYDGQLGSERTPGEFVDTLVECTREWVRVLKPTGSIWVNLGDKYNAYNGNRGEGTIQANGIRQGAPKGNGLDVKDIRPKSLIGIPWRYAIRCIDELGLILRAEVIWSKPNGLPESVTDRVRRSHEQWFHFTVSPRYYSAVDEIREPHDFPNQTRTAGRGLVLPVPNNTAMSRPERPCPENNPLGKLPGSVWTIPTQPLRVPAHLGIDHFAAFPMEWPRRIITGWSPREVCGACGEGRRPVSDRDPINPEFLRRNKHQHARDDDVARGLSAKSLLRTGLQSGQTPPTRILGYACACPDTNAPTTPGLVLDPFGGTGTTALVADVLGRDAIHVDLSADYCRLAEWRTTDPGERARAMQVEKPAEVIDGQMDLLEGLGA